MVLLYVFFLLSGTLVDNVEHTYVMLVLMKEPYKPYKLQTLNPKSPQNRALNPNPEPLDPEPYFLHPPRKTGNFELVAKVVVELARTRKAHRGLGFRVP